MFSQVCVFHLHPIILPLIPCPFVPPPPPAVDTDRSKYKHYSSVVLRTRAVKTEDGNSSGSCLWFRVPVWGFRVTVFRNVPPSPTLKMLCNVLAHYEKGGALRKTGTRNLQTGTRKHKQEPLL